MIEDPVGEFPPLTRYVTLDEYNSQTAEVARLKAELAQAQQAEQQIREREFQAGYREGLDTVRNAFVALRRNHMAVDACEKFGRWLEGKVGEAGA